MSDQAGSGVRRAPAASAQGLRAAAPDKTAPDEAPPQELIELLFFAYRDFVADADARLQDYEFGRAHHRVLHFVNSRPGMNVAELLDILRITKQSLSRVLRDVTEAGFVEARPGVSDRRQRLLHPTEKGSRLARELTRLQAARVTRALVGLDREERAAVACFLRRMIDDPAPRLDEPAPAPLRLAAARETARGGATRSDEMA